MRSNIRRDRSIFELVDEVQSYSNPQDAIPSPPVDKRPDPRSFVREPPPGRDGPDRHRPPDWFKPKDTEPAAIDDLGTDLPAVPEDTEVEIPAGNEDQEVATTGVEALAYYAPFHFYARRWGIYIRDFGLADLACKFLGRRKLTSADNWVLECAYHFLLQHEYFHFQTEVGVSRYEILLFQGALSSEMYLDHVYLRHFLDRESSWLEESVANARGYQALARTLKAIPSADLASFTSFLASWMKTQPPGYRYYDRWKGPPGTKAGTF